MEKGKGTLANRKSAFTLAMFYNKMILYNINDLTFNLYYETCIHNSRFLGTSNFCHFHLTEACIINQYVSLQKQNIHSLHSLPYDRSIASSKESCPQSSIQCFPFQFQYPCCLNVIIFFLIFPLHLSFLLSCLYNVFQMAVPT